MSDEYKQDKNDEDFPVGNNKGADEIKKLFNDLKSELREEFQDLREEIEDVMQHRRIMGLQHDISKDKAKDAR